jgi:chorismate dehydratase
MTGRIRIGSVGYLNAQPLIQAVDRSTYDVIEACPSAIAIKLASGEVDVALVPIVAVLTDPSLRVVPGVCIGASGPVESVLWVGETPPETWTHLVLDGESRTSAVLSRILLDGPMRDTMGDIEVQKGPPGCGVARAKGTTGALVIGDAARALPERLTHRVDLAEVWSRWTGHPFVFAVWAGRPDLPPHVVSDLKRAAEEGLRRREEEYQGSDRTYLTESIRYALDEPAHIGMRRFAALAHAKGWVPCSEVQLYGPPTQRVHRVNVDCLLQRAADAERLEGPELIQLGVEARLNDLAAAAHLKRELLHPPGEVTWRLGLRDTGLWAEDPACLERAVDLGVTDLSWSPETPKGAWDEVRTRHPNLRGHARWADVEPLGAWESIGVRGVSVDLSGTWSPRVRAQIDAQLRTPDQLAEELGQALESGLEVEATLGVGQGETLEERVEHLLALRTLHDRHGLPAVRVWAALCPGQPAGSSENTADDVLRMTALTRIALPGSSLRASPETEGLGVAQTALRMGCDSLGVIWLSEDSSLWVRQVEKIAYHLVTAGYGQGTSSGHASFASPERGPYRRTMVAPE